MIFAASMFFLGGIVKNSINVLVQMKKIKCRRLRLPLPGTLTQKKPFACHFHGQSQAYRLRGGTCHKKIRQEN